MNETRICSKCEETKLITDFALRRRQNATRRTECRTCHSLYTKNHYKEKTGLYKERNKIRRKEAQTFILSYLLNKECIECGNTDIRVLEFDHVRGSKIIEVSTMVGKCYSKEMILAEIDKCDLICRNCHQVRTAIKSNNYKQKFLESLTSVC